MLANTHSFATTQDMDAGPLTPRDFALSYCLSINYHQKDSTYARNLNDTSGLANKYTPADWNKIISFVQKNAADFHQDKYFVHFESGDKMMNTVFADCMKLYHSRKLKKFLEQNKLN